MEEMNRKSKFLLVAIVSIVMMMVAKSHASDFRLGEFKEHVSLRLDNSMVEILKQTSSIRWQSKKSILDKNYQIDFDFYQDNNPFHLQILTIKEFKRFQKKEGPIHIEFLDMNRKVLFEVDLYASRKKDENTGRNGFVYDFIYRQGPNGFK